MYRKEPQRYALDIWEWEGGALARSATHDDTGRRSYGIADRGNTRIHAPTPEAGEIGRDPVAERRSTEGKALTGDGPRLGLG